MTTISLRVRYTILLSAAGTLVLILALSSLGGPIANDYPLIAEMAPLALMAGAGLTASALYPPISLVIGVTAAIYAGDIKELGAGLACVITGSIFSLRRRSAQTRMAIALTLAFGILLLLMSYAAPIAPPPAIRRTLIFEVALCLAAVIIKPHARFVSMVVAATGLLYCYEALSHPALRENRDLVVLGVNANGVGFMCALAFVSGAIFVRLRLSLRTVLGVAICVIALEAIIVTGSRGAFLAAVAGTFVVALRRHINVITPRAIGLLLCAGGLLYFLSGPAMTWIAQVSGRNLVGNQNIASRESATIFAFHAAAQHPLTGVGVGDLDRYSLYDVNADYHLSAHNVFVGRFGESGLLVGALFIILLTLAFLRAWRGSATLILPLLTLTYVSGISFDWFVDGRASAVVMLLVGTALGTTSTRTIAEDSPETFEDPPVRVPTYGLDAFSSNASRSARAKTTQLVAVGPRDPVPLHEAKLRSTPHRALHDE